MRLKKIASVFLVVLYLLLFTAISIRYVFADQSQLSMLLRSWWDWLPFLVVILPWIPLYFLNKRILTWMLIGASTIALIIFVGIYVLDGLSQLSNGLLPVFLTTGVLVFVKKRGLALFIIVWNIVASITLGSVFYYWINGPWGLSREALVFGLPLILVGIACLIGAYFVIRHRHPIGKLSLALAGVALVYSFLISPHIGSTFDRAESGNFPTTEEDQILLQLLRKEVGAEVVSVPGAYAIVKPEAKIEYSDTEWLKSALKSYFSKQGYHVDDLVYRFIKPYT